MFHKIKNVVALDDYCLSISFVEGVTKKYNVKPLFERFKIFNDLENNDLFKKVHVGPGGYAIIWNDEIDLACDELYENGEIIKTPFDNLIAFSDATKIWSLNESTLRKAIKYGKLIDGVDACKFGKQWIVSIDSMKREYGEPKFN